MPVCSRALAVLALAALLAPAIARADFEDDYTDGLAALDHGEYGRAVQALKKALAVRPESPVMVRIEGVPQPYLPHHFLGIAYFKLGDCAAAKAQWNDQSNLRSLGRLRQLRAQEEQLQAQCTPVAVQAQEAPTKTQSAQAVVATPATPESAPVSNPPPKPTAVAVAGPPPALIRAYVDFSAGRFANAARLDVDAVNGANVRFQAYLLRSAARFALARSGEASQLEGARSDARAARHLDANALPDERVFSPAFRAFFAAAH
ncbi:MAG: hypothetical protein DYH18_04620 [Xanthomonadales bacterium PRO7]|nr:hypothetical protein [Xanthomonadales bacterium PRO7]